MTDTDSVRGPNVVMIFADDLSATFLKPGSGILTPNLNNLANQGRSFNRAYCQASLCNPSRNSIMTGLYPHELGIWTNEPHFRGIYPNIRTLPQVFKEQGYHSVGIGKIYHNWGQSLEGDADSWSEEQVYHWAAHYHDWYIPGRPYQLHFDIRKGPSVQHADVPDRAYLDGRIAQLAVNKLHQLQENRFFLAIGFWKPHLPFNAPKKYWDLYDREALPALRYPGPVESVPEIAYVDSREARIYTDISKSRKISESKEQELRHGYYAAISYLYAQVGKILQALDDLGLDKNTIVVFLSDHGYHAGEHGEFGKWTNLELGTRVPLIIRVPAINQPGFSSSQIVELVDLYPTLLDLCGLNPPVGRETLSGIPLTPILKDPDAGVKQYVLSQITRPLGANASFSIMGSTIRTKEYRYCIWHKRNEPDSILNEEFYDLRGDPYRVRNIADEARVAYQKGQLRHILEEITSR